MRKISLDKLTKPLSHIFFAAVGGAFMMEGFLLIYDARLMWAMKVVGVVNILIACSIIRISGKGAELDIKIAHTQGKIDAHNEVIAANDRRMAELLAKDPGFN